MNKLKSPLRETVDAMRHQAALGDAIILLPSWLERTHLKLILLIA